MGLVKTVLRKFFQEVENLMGPLFRNIVGRHAPGHKADPLLGHLLRILLSHGSAQHVRLPQSVTGQPVGRLLYLLLIHENPVRLAAHFLQQRMQILDFLPSFFPVNEVANKLHRPRTIQGN